MVNDRPESGAMWPLNSGWSSSAGPRRRPHLPPRSALLCTAGQMHGRERKKSAMTPVFPIVDSTEGLKALIAELEAAPYIALDTEFMRDQTYWPKLCLMQVAAPGIEAIIDPMADGLDLSRFYKLLRPPVLKVLHASRQDIEMFSIQGLVMPDPLFDTQIAAMVCG